MSDDDLIALLESAEGKFWITGREPTTLGDPNLICLRLTEADRRRIVRALRWDSARRVRRGLFGPFKWWDNR